MSLQNKTQIITIFILFSSFLYGSILKNYKVESSSFDISTSILNGTSYEIVYQTDGKLSELIWNLDNINLLELDYNLILKNDIRINTRIKTNFTAETSTMEDFDWDSDFDDVSNGEWTDYSKSDTEVNEVYQFDFYFEFPAYSNSFFNLYLLAGYKEDSFKWDAIGGEYIYSSSSFRDISGEFNDIATISYNQYFQTPYFGFSLNRDYKKAYMNAVIKYSAMVFANDEDTHHLRDLYFEEEFEWGEMLDFNFSISYKLSTDISFFSSFNYLKYYLNSGSTKVTDLSDGSITTYGDGSAGIEHESYAFSLGVKLDFDFNNKTETQYSNIK